MPRTNLLHKITTGRIGGPERLGKTGKEPQIGADNNGDDEVNRQEGLPNVDFG